MSVTSNGYKHHTTNNFKMLLKEKNGSENISMITILILIKIEIYIRLIGFLDNGVPDVMFNPNEKIQKGSVGLLLKEFVQC